MKIYVTNKDKNNSELININISRSACKKFLISNSYLYNDEIKKSIISVKEVIGQR